MTKSWPITSRMPPTQNKVTRPKKKTGKVTLQERSLIRIHQTNIIWFPKRVSLHYGRALALQIGAVLSSCDVWTHPCTAKTCRFAMHGRVGTCRRCTDEERFCVRARINPDYSSRHRREVAGARKIYETPGTAPRLCCNTSRNGEDVFAKVPGRCKRCRCCGESSGLPR